MFCRKTPDIKNLQFEEVKKKLCSFLEKEPEYKWNREDAGLYLAGFGGDDQEVMSCKIDITMHEIKTKALDMPSFEYDGMTHVVDRLTKGIDKAFQEKIEEAFSDVEIYTGKDNNEPRPLNEYMSEAIEDISASCCSLRNGIPIRDVIDYVHFLIYTTNKTYKFMPSAPVCGGEVEIAVITLDRGFRRVKTKPLDSLLTFL